MKYSRDVIPRVHKDIAKIRLVPGFRYDCPVSGCMTQDGMRGYTDSSGMYGSFVSPTDFENLVRVVQIK